MATPFHRVYDKGASGFGNLDHNFDFVRRKVVADELVLQTRPFIDLDDGSGSVSDCVEDVFTGQAVLERGSANSDVFEE